MLALALFAAAAITVPATFLAPRCVASWLSRRLRAGLADRTSCCRLVKDVAGACADSNAITGSFAGAVWCRPSHSCIAETYIDLIWEPVFADGLAASVAHLTKDAALKDTIRQGALEAFHDEELKLVLREVLMEGARDEELQNAILKAANSSVKMGIREALQDSELKVVMTDAIRDALADPHIRDIFLQAVKDTLVDEELHAATMQGAASALNPLRKINLPNLRQLPEFPNLPRPLDNNFLHRMSIGGHAGPDELDSIGGANWGFDPMSGSWRQRMGLRPQSTQTSVMASPEFLSPVASPECSRAVSALNSNAPSRTTSRMATPQGSKQPSGNTSGAASPFSSDTDNASVASESTAQAPALTSGAFPERELPVPDDSEPLMGPPLQPRPVLLCRSKEH